MRNSWAAAAHLHALSGETQHLTLSVPAHGHAGDSSKALSVELHGLMAIEDRHLDVRCQESQFHKNGEIALVEAHGLGSGCDRFSACQMPPGLMSSDNELDQSRIWPPVATLSGGRKQLFLITPSHPYSRDFHQLMTVPAKKGDGNPVLRDDHAIDMRAKRGTPDGWTGLSSEKMRELGYYDSFQVPAGTRQTLSRGRSLSCWLT
jgi:hypothetical protein